MTQKLENKKCPAAGLGDRAVLGVETGRKADGRAGGGVQPARNPGGAHLCFFFSYRVFYRAMGCIMEVQPQPEFHHGLHAKQVFHSARRPRAFYTRGSTSHGVMFRAFHPSWEVRNRFRGGTSLPSGVDEVKDEAVPRTRPAN